MTIPGRIAATVLSSAVLALPLAAVASPADAATYHFKNCTALHKKFKHGVGRNHAHDHHTSGTAVTNFKRSTTIYKKVFAYNRNLDRDRDGIACEKH